jgi:hypothetical protein
MSDWDIGMHLNTLMSRRLVSVNHGFGIASPAYGVTNRGRETLRRLGAADEKR